MKFECPLPASEQELAALKKRVAALHAEAVLHIVQALDCPAEEKFALLDAILTAVQPQDSDVQKRPIPPHR